MRTRSLLLWSLLAAVASPAAASGPSGADDGSLPFAGAEGHLSSSNTGTNAFSGLNINRFVGAERFYAAGYTGARAVVTNVEGGHVWNGHQTLSHVTTLLDARATYLANGVDPGRLGQADRHATWVGHAIAGRSTFSGGVNYQQGIAHGATLWSGALATEYGSPPWSNSWGWSRGYAFTDPYVRAMQTGVNGRRTDVVNSSWGFSGSTQFAGGTDVFTRALDGLARANRTTVVISAGNEGPNSGTLRAPASGYNSIAAGALGPDTAATGAYSTVATFSSRGPMPYVAPDGTVVPNARARIDLCAPGQNLTLAFYGGLTGGNVGGTDSSNGSTGFYTFNTQGTSFAAPIIAGGAALLCDLAYDRFGANAPNAVDGQVIKSVLLNSADKLAGWDNGQAADPSGAVRTTQALDHAQGAGAMNLARAFDQFTAGTTDVAGLGGSSDVRGSGWDFGLLNEGLFNDYLIGDILRGGTTFNATLNWFVQRDYIGTAPGGGIDARDRSFTDLGLELWSFAGGSALSLVASSDAAYLNTEHFSVLLPSDGQYLLRVRWNGELYDLSGNPNSSQTYGLSWSGVGAGGAAVVPEPGTGALVLVGAAFLLRRRRRGHQAP